MVIKKLLLIVIAALTVSLGALSVGYGYWTDMLNVEGSVDVSIGINVLNDIPEQIVTSEALQLTETPNQNQTDTDLKSSEPTDSEESYMEQSGEPELIVEQQEVTVPDSSEKIENNISEVNGTEMGSETISIEPNKEDCDKAENNTENPSDISHIDAETNN